MPKYVDLNPVVLGMCAEEVAHSGGAGERGRGVVKIMQICVT